MSNTNRGQAAGRLAAVLLGLLATVARADLRPVEIELLGEPQAALPGQTFTGQLRITSGAAGTLSGLRLEGPGWQVSSLQALPQEKMAKGESVDVAFAAVCGSDPKLAVLLEWNGVTVRKELDLSAKTAELAKKSLPVRIVPDVGKSDAPVASGSGSLRPAALHGAAKSPTAGAMSRSIRVRGRFKYTRPDAVQVGVYGMTVRIYDSDPGVDDHLVDTVTDTQGYFDVTFTFSDSWEEYPDIYVHFDAENTELDVENATWGYIYSWETGVYDDVASEVNIGTIFTGDESVEPALHLLTAVSRTWQFSYDYGYNPSQVEVKWPDGSDGAWYVDISETIHISREWEWSDQAPSHEFGHHWLHNWAPTPSPDYCNGKCDDSIIDCGHCVWCEEDSHIAWSEGFPNYLSYVVPMEYLARYGVAAADTLKVQDLRACDPRVVPADWDEPTVTEGYVSAVLVDIHDSDAGDSHGHYPGHLDQLAMGPEEIFQVVNEHEPLTAMSFLLTFKSHYPGIKEELWDTAANCGFDIDEENPAAPSTIVCNSHTSGVASSDPTVDMEWAPPSDDSSGANAYSYSFSLGSPALPNTTAEVQDATTCTSATLAPGTYYFCIRARDRAGNWSTGYGNWGPIVIRAAEPANLLEYARAGWDFPLVPSSSNGSTAGSTHVSATLPGGSGETYWNISGQNDGESATSVGTTGRLYVDEVSASSYSHGITNAHTTFTVNNRGPITVYGGRHTPHYRFDATDAVAETDEDDNFWAHQFVWTPLHLTAGTVVSQNSMEPSTAGWGYVRDGSTLWYNCRGLRFDNSGWWNAVVMWSHELDDNYDLRMHLVSTGAQNGFAANIANSTRSAGYLDAVLVNRNCIATVEYDVGVVHHGTDADLGYDIVHVENDYADFDDPVTVTLGDDHWLALYEFEAFAEQVGPISVVVETVPLTANVTVQWRAEDFVTGRLTDCDATTATGSDGKAILQFTVPETGMNNVCLYRDPKDGSANVSVTFRIRKTPPDMAPYVAAGWHSPLVPRQARDGTPTSVALPDTLLGNASSTYHNLALTNLSPAAAGDTVDAYIWLDGASHAALRYLDFPAYGVSKYNYASAYTVRGGRHTLSLNIDAMHGLLELNELNNVYGEQYVWSPYDLGPGLIATRVAPPAMDGGWTYVTSGEPRWYDCDGLRMADPTSWWAAIAVMPGDTSNVDVRLHEPLVGAKDGFAANLAVSSWGKGCSDYVLVNFNLTDRHSYDAGVLRISGAQAYTANHIQSTYLGANPDGAYGPFSLGANAILRLHEMHLTAGTWAFRLDNYQGGVNWGICLHPGDQTYLKKSTVVTDGASWLNGAGKAEWFTVAAPAAGYYCLAVWKAGTSDLTQTGQYNLRIQQGVTAVEEPGDPPALTRLAGIHPNPFNPQTTIAYELATASPVRITIHDLAGRRVRTLVDGTAPAGRHAAVWDGRDEHGQALASGAYVAQLVAGEVRQSRKLVMLK
jgi:hypothetical protein